MLSLTHIFRRSNARGSSRLRTPDEDLWSDARCQCLIAQPAEGAQRLHRLEYVVHADDLRALLDRFQCESDASAQAPGGRRFARQRSDRTLAARPDYDRTVERME